MCCYTTLRNDRLVNGEIECVTIRNENADDTHGECNHEHSWQLQHTGHHINTLYDDGHTRPSHDNSQTCETSTGQPWWTNGWLGIYDILIMLTVHISCLKNSLKFISNVNGVHKRNYLFKMNIMEEIFVIRSCVEIWATDIKIYAVRNWSVYVLTRRPWYHLNCIHLTRHSTQRSGEMAPHWTLRPRGPGN